jgi:uncharacterized OsmC-like protein
MEVQSSADRIAAAFRRLRKVLTRAPELGLHEDAPAIASWMGGAAVLARHANGTQFRTDMPSELGGGGTSATPGWLFRAGLASCTATCIVMRAADEGIELTELEVVASSRSDTRAIVGICDPAGAAVPSGPRDVRLKVRIAARNAAPERLRALVEESYRCSPVPSAVVEAVPVALETVVG